MTHKSPAPTICPFGMALQCFDEYQRDGPENVTVCPYGEPMALDGLAMAPMGLWMSELHSWETAVSDVVGCVDLSSPRQVVPTMELQDGSCPTIYISSRS